METGQSIVGERSLAADESAAGAVEYSNRYTGIVSASLAGMSAPATRHFLRVLHRRIEHPLASRRHPKPGVNMQLHSPTSW